MSIWICPHCDEVYDANDFGEDWVENGCPACDRGGEVIEMNIYERVLSQYGIVAQRMMLIEETGKVMQALSHEYRGRCDEEKVAAELIDLQIVLNSVKLHYMNEAEWNDAMNEAEERLERRLNQRGR